MLWQARGISSHHFRHPNKGKASLWASPFRLVTGKHLQPCKLLKRPAGAVVWIAGQDGIHVSVSDIQENTKMGFLWRPFLRTNVSCSTGRLPNQLANASCIMARMVQGWFFSGSLLKPCSGFSSADADPAGCQPPTLAKALLTAESACFC